MNLILHLVRWDVRRFRLLLLLWVLVVAAGAVLTGAWPVAAVAVSARNTVGLAGGLLALTESLFSVALITLVIQEHPLVGTTAFWMTRPIPPLALLASKLVLLTGVMVVVPVLAEVLLMVAYGVPAANVAAVAAQSSMIWVFWLGIVTVFAALTANMASLAVAVVGAIATVFVSILIVVTVIADRVDRMPQFATAEPAYDPTTGVVTTVVVICTFLVVLAVLYRTRTRPLAVAICLAGIATAFGAATLWSWPLLAPHVDTPAWAMDTAVLQLSADANSVDLGGNLLQHGIPPPAWKIARARMRLSGMAAGWSAGVGLRESSIRVEGSDALESRVYAAPVRVAIDETERVQSHEVTRRLLNVERLVDWMPHTRPESAIVMVARTADLRRLGAGRGAYEGTFGVSLAHHKVEAVLPLRADASVRASSYQFAVDSIQLLPNRILLLAHESDARSVFDGRPRSRVEYFLRNVATSEAVQGSRRELRNDVTLSRFIPFAAGIGESENSGFRAAALEMHFATGYGGEQEILFDSTWFDRAELVIVRVTEEGAVDRRLLIPDFPLGAE